MREANIAALVHRQNEELEKEKQSLERTLARERYSIPCRQQQQQEIDSCRAEFIAKMKAFLQKPYDEDYAEIDRTMASRVEAMEKELSEREKRVRDGEAEMEELQQKVQSSEAVLAHMIEESKKAAERLRGVHTNLGYQNTIFSR